MEKINGLKTYIVGAGMVIYGIYLVSEGQTERGVEMILGGLGLAGLRHGVAGKRSRCSRVICSRYRPGGLSGG